MLTVELLLGSVTEWNAARKAHQKGRPNLKGADLSGAQLNKADLSRTDLVGANLRGADLSGAQLNMADLNRADLNGAHLYNANFGKANLIKTNLSKANLSGATLWDANLSGADLRGAQLICAILTNATLTGANLTEACLNSADLTRANLIGGDFTRASFSGANLDEVQLAGADLTMAFLDQAKLYRSDLSGANLCGAKLSRATLIEANLSKADMHGVIIWHTIFVNVDLSNVKGLDTVHHVGPSTVGIDTLCISKGNIPEVFLKGCGVPDTFIEYAHSLTSKAIEFYSCFISHSTADKAFADRLYADLQAKGVRCWYAPHDMKGGKKIHDQIGEAIRQHEKLLLILSESSINSEWVKQEITKAKKREDREGKRVLFPISLIEYSKIQEWEFPDSKGRDLAEEIRLYYIPSFVGWEKDNEAYTKEFGKLLNSFQAERDIEGKA